MPVPPSSTDPGSQSLFSRLTSTKPLAILSHDEKLHKRVVDSVITALIIGIVVILLRGWSHPFNISSFLTSGMTGITALGAAIALGGILGFLFGVPSAPRGPIINNRGSGTVAVTTGADSKATAGPATPPAAPPPSKPADPGNDLANTGDNPDETSPPDAEVLTAGTDAKPSATVAKPTGTEQDDGQTSDSDADDKQIRDYQPGVSNLEQVADWVTKLLLGGGLTQMQRIPPKVWQWSHALAIGMLGTAATGAQDSVIVSYQAFASGLLVYGFILGFFGGFLITKLQLGKAISQ
jgi:hypothetical protein